MHRLPVGRKRLQRLVEDFRLDINDRATGGELYRVLLAPASGELVRDEPIAIVPDEVLHALPFAALTEPGADGRYLIESHPVSIVLQPLARSPVWGGVPEGPAFVIGNPTIIATLRSTLPSLLEAESEAVAIAALYQNTRLLVGPDATRRRFMKEAGAHRIVHFAGHARSSARDSGASAMFLAPDGDDGVLYARELAALPLTDVALLVLAGCTTAEGRTFSLEGMSGLSRAALAAGAHHVVATLGAIDDEASAYLFPRFHQSIARGVPPAIALHAVQLQMIRSGDRRLARPSAWAFVELMTAG